jgi:hypothetical protein
MLRLVESFATKTQRAKSTTVQFMPLRARSLGYKCDWCGQIVNERQRGWISFKAVVRSPGVGDVVIGDVCNCDECRISVQAKYAEVG